VSEALKKLLHQHSHTRLSGTTDADRRLLVRGFFGQYGIKRTDRGAPAPFSLTQDGPKELVVRLPTEARGKSSY